MKLPPTYERWADGKLHQLTASMVSWMVAAGVVRLTVLPLGDGDWPAYRLVRQLKYKCQHVGIVLVEADLETESTERAAASLVKKGQKKAGRARKAVRDMKEVIG